MEGLNAEQRLAVEADDGPLLIVAGPGTGKTKTLTARIVHLIHSERAKPQDIVALTFTNKAAREMRSRIKDYLTGSKLPLVTTFHALANNTAPVDKTLITEPERADIVRLLKKKGKATRSVQDIVLLISNSKNQLVHSVHQEDQAIVDAYNAELAAQNKYDFDDLLTNLYTQLKSEDFRTKHQFKYVLVDEFQDTNELQYELLKLLTKEDNIFAIGDPLQSIYGFRGANAGIFEKFKNDYPNATQVTLITNYRSVPAIVKTACTIFPDALQLQAHRNDVGGVYAIEVLNEYGEADWVVNEIEKQLGGSTMLGGSTFHASGRNCTFRDFAVVYRTHSVAKTLKRSLEASGIPYQIAGEGSPYLQPGIREVNESLAYMAGMGEPPQLKHASNTQIKILLDNVKRNAIGQKIVHLAEQVAKKLDLETEKNAATLGQFLGMLVRFNDWTLQDYVTHIQEIAEQEYYDPTADAVTLLTIHASKGLEFSRVLLIGAEEGIIPFERQGAVADIAEEKRLFYVAITRARDELYMLHARKRAGEPHRISSFVSELPQDCVEHEVDPAIGKQIKKLQSRERKRSQTSLF